MELCPVSGESRREEIANSITHGLGFFLSLVGFGCLIAMCIFYGEAVHMLSCVIYGSSLILLYGVSTAYHFSRSLRVKHVLKILDHICIYLLIAGTYTPYTLIVLKGVWRWTFLGIVWGSTLIGIPLKAIGINRFKILSVIFYLFLGWLSLIACVPLVQSLSLRGFMWLLLGGIFYTLGTIFYAVKRLPFNHAFWHLFVLLGSFCHYISIMFYVVIS